MQIQLSGINGASQYIYINTKSQLPVDGTSTTFQNSISNIGQLYHVKIINDEITIWFLSERISNII